MTSSRPPGGLVRAQVGRLSGVERDIALQSIVMMICARLARSRAYRVRLKQGGMELATALLTGRWFDD